MYGVALKVWSDMRLRVWPIIKALDGHSVSIGLQRLSGEDECLLAYAKLLSDYVGEDVVRPINWDRMAWGDTLDHLSDVHSELWLCPICKTVLGHSYDGDECLSEHCRYVRKYAMPGYRRVTGRCPDCKGLMFDLQTDNQTGPTCPACMARYSEV